MTNNYDVDDPWMADANTAAAPAIAPLCQVQAIENIVPLDDRSGDDLTVPLALRPALFDPVAASKRDIAAVGGQADLVPPMYTYAILDAGQIVNLPDILASAELPHRCLFQGNALETLQNAAPWLVQLDPDHRLTRHLFTTGDMPWSYWPRDAGIYLRSRASLTDLRNHFRYFTRVQDDRGKWLFFRFWDSAAATALFSDWQFRPEKIAAFQSRPGKWPIHSILCISSSSARATHIILGNDSQRPAANAPFRIDTQDRAALSRARTIAFDTALIASLASDVPTFAALPSALQNRWYSGMMQDATAANIRLEPAIRSFALAALLLGKNPAEHSETKHFFTDATLHEKDKARLALQIARKN